MILTNVGKNGRIALTCAILLMTSVRVTEGTSIARARESGRSRNIDIFAKAANAKKRCQPGEGLFVDGTSFSAPIATGVAA